MLAQVFGLGSGISTFEQSSQPRVSIFWGALKTLMSRPSPEAFPPSPSLQTQLPVWLRGHWPLSRHQLFLLGFAPSSGVYVASIPGCHGTGLGLGEGRGQTLILSLRSPGRSKGIWEGRAGLASADLTS